MKFRKTIIEIEDNVTAGVQGDFRKENRTQGILSVYGNVGCLLGISVRGIIQT